MRVTNPSCSARTVARTGASQHDSRRVRRVSERSFARARRPWSWMTCVTLLGRIWSTVESMRTMSAHSDATVSASATVAPNTGTTGGSIEARSTNAYIDSPTNIPR